MNQTSRLLFLLLQFLLVASIVCNDDLDCSENDIIQLDFGNIPMLYDLQEDEVYLLFLYSPTCGACTTSKNMFERVHEDLKDNCNYKFAWVDCSEHQGVCMFFNIKGYPTIYAVVQGNLMYEYKETRTVENIRKFLEDGHMKGFGILLPQYSYIMGQTVFLLLRMNEYLGAHKTLALSVVVSVSVLFIFLGCSVIILAFYLIFLRGKNMKKEKKQ